MPQVATVTRVTSEHIWFRFAQEGEDSAEAFCPRGFAVAIAIGTELVVDMIEPGLWYLADPTSLSVE